MGNVDGDIMMTVKMLAYNHEAYIAQAIESVVSQKTEYRFELLIGEDCSTDGTRKVIEKYAKLYPDIIRPIYHKENQGCTKNSYSLDMCARGKYIAGCEGDDFWCDENRIQKDIDFLEAHPEYSGVCHRCKVVDEEGNELPESNFSDRVAFWRYDKEIYTLKDFERWVLPGHGSARTGRNLVLKNREDNEIVHKASTRVGDRTHVLLQVLDGDIYCMDDVVSCYRYRIAGGAGNFSSLQHQENLKAEEYLMFCRLEQWTKEVKKVALDLDWVKKDRFAGSVSIWLKRPIKENWGVVYSIIRNSGAPIKYVYYMIKVVVLKVVYYCLSKEDKMIRL